MSDKNCIIIDYSPFSQDSKVYIYQNDEQQSINIQSDLNGLAETIVGLAYGKNNFNIKIQAPFAIIDEMAKQVRDLEQSLYSENKIIVRGI